MLKTKKIQAAQNTSAPSKKMPASSVAHLAASENLAAPVAKTTPATVPAPTPAPAPKKAGSMGGGPMGIKGGGDKARNFKKSMRRLIVSLKGQYFAIIIALLLAAASAVCTILGPRLLEILGKEILVPVQIGDTSLMNMTKINRLGIILVSIYVSMFALNFLQHIILNSVSVKACKKLRTQISQKINRLPLKYFDNTSYGDVLSRVTNDVDTIAQSLSQSLGNLISSFTLVCGIPIMMFTMSWQLTLINTATIPISFLLMVLLIRFSQKYFRAQQQSLGALNGHIEETYSAHSVIKVFNGTKKVQAQFEAINNNLYKNGYKAQFFSTAMFPIISFVGNLGYVFTVVVGAVLASGNLAFAATITAFIQYVRIFNNNVSQVATVANTLQSAAAAGERIFEFLDEEEMPDEQSKQLLLQDIKGNIEFRNVKFGYDADREIIHNFSLKVKAGQKIAIVGPTGAGKTTMVNLLMRFYDATSGDILVDGTSIYDIRREQARKMFGMVLQDTWLFEGTILENMRFGKPDATMQEVEEACRAAHVDHFIKTLPGSYDMLLNEEANISQGQRQLLAIARAMIQNAPMMILDEATSSIDTRSEILIQKAMDKLMKNRTSFVIAHRLSTIKNADVILVMKDGDVIETGNHETLMKQKGFYCDLYNSQFSLEGNNKACK